MRFWHYTIISLSAIIKNQAFQLCQMLQYCNQNDKMFLIFLNQNQLIHFFIKTNFIKASIQFYLYSFSKAKIQMIFQQETNKKQSPFKTKSFQKLEPSKQDIVKRLLYVFTYYAGKVSKYNYRQMQQKYFMELMSDVWVIAGKETDFERNSLTWRNIQNVYYSKGRKQLLDFNQFLEILPTISVYFQTQITRQQAVKAFIYFLNAIYENVVLKELQSWRIIAQSDYISQDTRAFIMKLSPDFTKIYKIYFPEQMNNKFKEKDYYYKSFQTYLQVMKQFEIYPKLISASQLFFIFHSSIQSFSHSLITQSEQSRQTVQQLGQVFKLSKFIQAFIPVSRVALSKLKQIDDPQMQQWAHKQKQTLKILLQYMETIKSVKNKKCKYSQSRFSFIIYQQYPEEHTMKKFLIKDKIIKQPQNKLSFYELFDKMKI